jgi:hypothetical protein
MVDIAFFDNFLTLQVTPATSIIFNNFPDLAIYDLAVFGFFYNFL